MERVFYNFHSQLCGTVLRRSTSRSRRLLEYTVLLGGIFGFSVLLISHVSFVHRNQDGPIIPVSCLSSIPDFQQDNVDVTHIILLRGGENSYAITTYGGSPEDNTTCHSRNPWKEENTTINLSFSKTSGFLLLPPEKVSQHNISTQWVGVSRTNTHCFGEPFLQRIVFGIVGPDTVLHNWLLSSFGSGFLYNPLTQNLQEITPPIARIKLGTSSLSWQKQFSEAVMWKLLSWKAGVVLTSIFLFFITTTLTSFTFRETQQRMLEFTIQLQNYVREDRPLVKLIFTHVMQNLLFVPIMVGMMFFLIEFYGGDKVLAFMVLSLVWVCEAFSVVSLRSQEGLQFFPRIFFLLFLMFHVYFFSFPHGFSYTALASTAAFLVHSMLFFWNRYELPAVAHGLVTLEHPRMAGDGTISAQTTSPPQQQQQQQQQHHQQPISPRLASIPGSRQEEHAQQLHLRQRSTTVGLEEDPSQSLFAQRTSGTYPSTSTLGQSIEDYNMSRTTSSAGLFQMDNDGEDSCLYMLGGEVVMLNNNHRCRRSTSIESFSTSASILEGEERPPRRRHTSSSEDQVPLEVETSACSADITPRMGSSRYSSESLAVTAPSLPSF